MANCIKCGKELGNTKVFCEDCQAVMKQYPVPTGTPLVIHQRPETKKTAIKKKTISPEEQVIRLRKKVKRLAWTVVLLVLLLICAAGWLFWEIYQPEPAPADVQEGVSGSLIITMPPISGTSPETTGEPVPEETPELTAGNEAQ